MNILINDTFASRKRTMNRDAILTRLSAWLLILFAVTLGCTHQPRTHDGTHINQDNARAVESLQNNRSALKLSPPAEKVHRAVMREHLEAIHEIVSALAEGNFSKAEHITITQLGFAKHREAMGRQQPEAFPRIYHDLAMAHHQAAEELARAMPSHDVKEILPRLERTLLACVACHQAFEF